MNKCTEEQTTKKKYEAPVYHMIQSLPIHSIQLISTQNNGNENENHLKLKQR